jgi:choline monooxygenase
MHATNPFSWYVDRDVLRRENDKIFARSWQYVAHSGEIGPGTTRAASVGEIPIVLARADDGMLRASRHDAAPASVDTWGPFVFANPDAGAPPLTDALGQIPAQVRELGLDVDALAFHHRAEWELEANWKIACENFLECYHCPVAHPRFSTVVDVSPDAYRLEAEGLTSTQFGPLRDGTNGSIPRSQFHFLWPNTGINVFGGEPNLSIGPILPLTAARTRRYLDYFFGPDVDDEWIRELLELDDLVGSEDTALVQGVQRGAGAGVVGRGTILGQSEQLVAHFQRLTAAALA